MSKYTTEVRYICETNTSRPIDGNGFNSIEEIIDTSHVKIFNFTYPIFDIQYRATLEKKILRHFYTREICEETVGLWKLRLCDKLNIIMPYYNQLYKSALLEFNPLYDVDYTVYGNKNDDEIKSNTKFTKGNEDIQANTINNSVKNENNTVNKKDHGMSTIAEKSTKDGTDYTTNVGSIVDSGKGTSTNTIDNDTTTTTTGTDWQYYSDTPQGSVAYLDAGTYLTNATKNTKDDSVTGTNDTTETQNESYSNAKQQTNNEQYDSNFRTETSSTNAVNKNVEEKANKDESKIDNEISKKNKSFDNQNTSYGNIKNMREYTEHVTGKKGSVNYSKMLMDFRQTFLNIDNMILEELEPLFFGLW